MKLTLLSSLLTAIFILIYSVCCRGDEKTYTINIHIFKRSSSDLLIYRAVQQASVTSSISRVNMSFHSNTNIEKGVETFALDHCLNPREISPRKINLILSFRSIVKIPEVSCMGDRFFNLNKFIEIIASDVTYIRLTQHSDRKKMRDAGSYVFHSDFKYGVPAKPKELRSGIKMFKINSHKNFPSRLNRWLAHSSDVNYIHAKHTMKFIENFDYHDFLLGSNCNFGIIEVSIINSAAGTNNAGLLFYNFSSSEAMLIEVQSPPQSGFYSGETSTPDTAHNNSDPEPGNDRGACRVSLTSYQFSQ